MKPHRHPMGGQARHADDWLITYADTITLLLCLFAILLAARIAAGPRVGEMPARPPVPQAVLGATGPAIAADEIVVVPPLVVAGMPVESSDPREDVEGDAATAPANASRPPTKAIDPLRESAAPPAHPVMAGPAPANVPARRCVGAQRPETMCVDGRGEAGHDESAAIAPPVAPATAMPIAATPVAATTPRLNPSPPAAVAPPEPKGDRIMLFQFSSAAFFASGSATLTAPGRSILAGMIGRLQSGRFADYRITVEGHTDDEPVSTAQFPSNWELSAARAAAVVRFFLEQGVAAQRLRAAGYADTMPLAPDRDADGRPIPQNQARNRRVVIELEKIDHGAS